MFYNFLLSFQYQKARSIEAIDLNLYPATKVESIFMTPNLNSDNTITLIAQTPNGNSKKLVVKLSQLVLIKKEEFEASLTEIKQENVPPLPVTLEDDLKETDLTLAKMEVKNFDFEKKYVVLDNCLKEQIKEKYSENKELNTFKCQICEKQFISTSRFQKHIQSHCTDEDRACTLCGKIFRNLSMLQKHERTHKVTRLACDYCNKELASKHQLDIHIRRHKGDYSHKCGECGKEYYNSKAFRQHIESEHKGIRYTCLICGSILRSRRYWKDHMAKHTDTDVKRYLCRICNKFYSSKAALNGHMKIHSEERFECNVCGKKSTQKAAHLVHMRLHTGEKDFVCEMCGKGFVRKDMLQIHKRRVHDLSKQQCEYCQEEFETEHHLLIHYHSHEEVEKNFPCEFCPKKFIDINFLRNHVNRVHVENKSEDVIGTKSPIKSRRRDEKLRCIHCDKQVLKSHDCLGKIDISEQRSLGDYSCLTCYEKFDDVEAYEFHTLHRHNAKCPVDDVMYEFKDDIINSDGMVEVCIGHDDIEQFENESKVLFQDNVYTNINYEQDIVPQADDPIQSKYYLMMKSTPDLPDNNLLENAVAQLNDSDSDLLNLLAGEEDILRDITETDQFEQLINTSVITSTSEEYMEGSNITGFIKIRENDLPELYEEAPQETADVNVSKDVKSNDLKCSYCEKICPTKKLLRNHLMIHTGLRPYSCDICKKTFRHNYEVSVHKKSHNQPTLQCDICSKMFIHKSHLTAHRRKHLGDFTAFCDICNKGFVSQSSYGHHIKIKHDKVLHVCEICGSKLSSLSSLKEHKLTHQPDYREKRTHVCEFCGKSYLSVRHLRGHLKCHTEFSDYVCNICGKTLTTKSNLRKHIANHSNDKKFQCSYCGKSFGSKEHLTVHKRIHTGDKPFKCSLCGKAFSQKISLTVHTRYHTGERPYKCDCGQSFFTKSHLMAHCKTHKLDNIDVRFVP